jgi:hypothetical protein
MKPSDSKAIPCSPACPEQPRRACPEPRKATALLPRCRHKTSSGNPCRYFARPNSLYCKRHTKTAHPEAATLAAELIVIARNFDSPQDVRNVLCKIFHALVFDLITERRAGILCYMAHTILHSQRAQAQFQKLADQKAAADSPKEQEDDLTWNLP